MDENQVQINSQNENETYLKVWQAEQEYVRTRWTIVTFFMSISFAIFGFSFQTQLALPSALAIRIAGLLIYWFAYLLHIHFYDYTRSLRSYLIEMESSKRVTLDIQSKIGKDPKAKRLLSVTELLFYFGIIYTIGLVCLVLLKL